MPFPSVPAPRLDSEEGNHCLLVFSSSFPELFCMYIYVFSPFGLIYLRLFIWVCIVFFSLNNFIDLIL